MGGPHLSTVADPACPVKDKGGGRPAQAAEDHLGSVTSSAGDAAALTDGPVLRARPDTDRKIADGPERAIASHRHPIEKNRNQPRHVRPHRGRPAATQMAKLRSGRSTSACSAGYCCSGTSVMAITPRPRGGGWPPLTSAGKGIKSIMWEREVDLG